MKVPGISKRAVDGIREAWNDLPAEDRDNLIAVLGEEADVKPLGRSMNVQILRYPVMNWYPREQIPENLPRHFSGIDIAFDLDDSLVQLHQNHVVDYVGGRFTWADATDVEADNSDLE
jgi:hypothetical protein